MEGQTDLLQIVGAVNALSGVFRLAECRQQKRSQNGDHHQKLKQSAPLAAPHADELRFNDSHTLKLKQDSGHP